MFEIVLTHQQKQSQQLYIELPLGGTAALTGTNAGHTLGTLHYIVIVTQLCILHKNSLFVKIK